MGAAHPRPITVADPGSDFLELSAWARADTVKRSIKFESFLTDPPVWEADPPSMSSALVESTRQATAWTVIDRCKPMWAIRQGSHDVSDEQVYQCDPDVTVLGVTLSKSVDPDRSYAIYHWVDRAWAPDVALKYPLLVEGRTLWIPEPVSNKERISTFSIFFGFAWLEWGKRMGATDEEVGPVY